MYRLDMTYVCYEWNSTRLVRQCGSDFAAWATKGIVPSAAVAVGQLLLAGEEEVGQKQPQSGDEEGAVVM